MLQTRMAPANGLLQRYVWAYGMTTGRIDSRPLVIPLPARPKQLLTFSFGNRFGILRSGSIKSTTAPRIAVVGPQTCAQPGLSVFGPVDNFAIHFQPAGFNQLFGLPMTELTDNGFDAHAVVGSEASALDRELGDTSSFAERIQIAERHLMRLAGLQERPDAVAIAANSLFACHGQQSVAAMASRCGISTRQFERRFLSQVGVPPKLYARIIRFNAAVDHKLHWPGLPWSRIAHEQDYHDQMHLVRDCQSFTGESPSRFLARLGGAPAFHAFYATEDRVRRG